VVLTLPAAPARRPSSYKNNLCGAIPPSIGGMRRLLSLELAGNYLKVQP
jgi:hypothetical protein